MSIKLTFKLFSSLLFLFISILLQGFVGYSKEVRTTKNKVSSVRTLNIKVENPIAISRENETISLSYELLIKGFKKDDLQFLEITDAQSGKTLVCQPIDYNQDGVVDEFLFQTNFKPKEIKYFSVTLSDKEPEPSSVYAKFISKPEGLGDFSWENDYIGYRMYGQARADAQGTGTAIDVWCKRTSDRLTDKWYEPKQSYHVDKGYGADHYASGKNQGCGGSGIYYKGQVYFSKSYSSSKIIANGPIRLVFELEFTGWQLENTGVKEVKRITLDAGTYFNQIESTYKFTNKRFKFSHAVGIVQRSDSKAFIDKKEGFFDSWERLTIPAGQENGYLGCGFIADPSSKLIDVINNKEHLYGLMVAKSDKTICYYTGAAWSEFGAINSFEVWKAYVKNKWQCINNKCVVSIK